VRSILLLTCLLAMLAPAPGAEAGRIRGEPAAPASGAAAQRGREPAAPASGVAAQRGREPAAPASGVAAQRGREPAAPASGVAVQRGRGEPAGPSACAPPGARCLPGAPARAIGVRGVPLPALRAVPDPVEGGRIVDALGREVLLRGVNVNAFVEYWAYDPALFTTYPFTEADAEAIAAMGWNAVRLLLSWSRVEPEPGRYDDAYLDDIEAAIETLERHGIYTVVDLHQDAWGPSLAARPGEACPPGDSPAFGWDGAPAWATLDGGQPRCVPGVLDQRETSPAVRAAFDAFWADAPGPGGVGIRTRYLAMLAHVVARLARHDAVAGWDLMNEPNAFGEIFGGPGTLAGLAGFYAEAVAAVRAAEAAVGAPRRLVFFEPSALWAVFDFGAPPPFTDDDQIVYSPHLYQGGLGGTLSEAAFDLARADAATYGGAPVVTGEWGSGPERAADPGDDYFERHQALQDRYRFGALLWTWREACGDPHKAGDARAGRVPEVWGLFDVDCATNQVRGWREALVAALRRPVVRAAPGAIAEVRWDPAARRFELRGAGAPPGASFAVFWPSRNGQPPWAAAQGLHAIRFEAAPGGQHYVVGLAKGGAWQLRLGD